MTRTTSSPSRSEWRRILPLAIGLLLAYGRPCAGQTTQPPLPPAMTSTWANDTMHIERLVQTRYEARVHRMQQRWMALIPSLSNVQYAGNVGVVSVGIGWDYGRNDHWETWLQWGFLPKRSNDHADLTMTLRQNLVPWSIGLGSRRWADPASNDRRWSRRSFASFEPLVGGALLNTIFDEEFWVHEPRKYNGGNYYRFSSKVRLHLSVGSRVSINVPTMKRKHFSRVSLYYDLSTYDLAIISAIPNKYLTLRDILALGFGVQYKYM